MVEKLRSLLRFGPISTRYKDLYDMCYLLDVSDQKRLRRYIDKGILNNPDMREKTITDIDGRPERTFNSRTYRRNVERSRSSNWLDISYDNVTEKILGFFRDLDGYNLK